jgi:hypothetical protein
LQASLKVIRRDIQRFEKIVEERVKTGVSG